MKKPTPRQKNQPAVNSTVLPTKSELLACDIVMIDSKHKSVTANTLKIADYFGKAHKNVLQRIARLIKSSRLKIKPREYLDERGKAYKFYELERQQFAQVVLGFTGDAAEQFRLDYTMEFERKDAENIEWQEIRSLSAVATNMVNDSILPLSEKLSLQYPSSSKGGRLFIHLHGSINVAAGCEYHLKRQHMTHEQLKDVTAIEMEVNAFIDNHESDDSMTVRDDLLFFLKG